MKKLLATCLSSLLLLFNPSVLLAEGEQEIEEIVSSWVGVQGGFLIYLNSNGYDTWEHHALARGNFSSLMRLAEAGYVEGNRAFLFDCGGIVKCSILTQTHQFRLTDQAIAILQRDLPGGQSDEWIASRQSFDSDGRRKTALLTVGPIAAARITRISDSRDAFCDYWARVRLFIDNKSEIGNVLLSSEDFLIDACFKFDRDGLSFRYSIPVY